MAPGRRKKAKRSKAKNSLTLGDLVLAKVKGFPAWPAKISRPEDWKQSPDPKKYFVEFFGTAEIAFVTPDDIQAFTCETKSKLVRGKTVKYFARAVKEICKAFEELEQKKSGDSRDDIDSTAAVCLSSSDVRADSKHQQHHKPVGLKDKVEVLEHRESDENDAPDDELYGLERCSPHGGNTDSLDVKNGTSYNTEHSSCPLLTVRKEAEVSSEGALFPNKDTISDTRLISCSYPIKGEISCESVSGNDENISLGNGKAASCSKGEAAGRRDGCSNDSSDFPIGLVDNKEECSPPLVAFFRAKSSSGQRVIMEGNEKKSLVPESREVELAVVQGKMCIDPQLLSNDSSDGYLEHPETRKDPKDEIICKKVQGETASYGSIRESSPCIPKLDADVHTGKKAKRLLKGKNVGSDNSLCTRDHTNSTSDKVDVKGNDLGLIKKKEDMGLSSTDFSKQRALKTRKHKMATVEDSYIAKRSRHVGRVNDMAEGSTFIGRKTDSTCTIAIENKQDKLPETQKSISNFKAESHVVSRTEECDVGSQLVVGDEAVLPIMKRRRRALEAMIDFSTKPARNTTGKSSGFCRNESLSSNNDGSPTTQVCSVHSLCYPVHNEEGGQQKSHVHQGSTDILKLGTTNLSDKICSTNMHQSLHQSQSDFKDINVASLDSARSDDKPSKYWVSPVKALKESLLSTTKKSEEKREKRLKNAMESHVTSSPMKLESQRPSSDGMSISMKNTPGSAKAVEPKTIKDQVKQSGSSTLKQVQGGFSKGLSPPNECLNHSDNLVMPERNKPTSEMLKATPKTNSRLRAAFLSSVECSSKKDIFPGERVEFVKAAKASHSLNNSKFTDSSMSMKCLIAAAQAKSRQTHSQSLNHPNAFSAFVSTLQAVQADSPSPASSIQPFSSGNMMQQYVKGFSAHTSTISPSPEVVKLVSQNQIDAEEYEDIIVNSGYKKCGVSLSGGTEAAVARGAFEGMMETLSRTKESIGRATLLAIDCAKFGIATEVVELLIQKLENEPSFHRKVDLFFLVDSITQRSHSQRGIAGASYIPIVQAALPRLLRAAAPSGAGARENRRQCHKVLRLWLERNILPGSLLRRYMDDIGVFNDDMTGFSLRRPSCAERSVDDPIRDMEGMFVDEYGSNMMIQIPGFLFSDVFEDEEDLAGSLCKDTGDESPQVEAPSEIYAVAPSDRRYCILEEVDGELEMEDVSASPKEERAITENISLKLETPHSSGRIFEMEPNNLSELPLPLGSPSLPLDSPPPLPPPLHPSPPPPPTVLPQPLQPPPQSKPPPPQILSSTSPSFVYHPPLSQEYCSIPTGNQPNLPANAPLRGPANVALKSDMARPQSICFVATGICDTQDMSSFGSSRSFGVGHSDTCLPAQASYSNQQFRPPPRPYDPLPHAQSRSSHLSYAKPTVRPHVQQPFHPSPSRPNGHRQYNTDKQWRIQSSNFSPDNECGAWVARGRTPCSVTPFIQEGFFQPPIERPLTSPISFQHAVHRYLAPRSSMAGHSVGEMFPCRPGILPLNCWRRT